ncbi:hypothetical protein ASPFODRAFT_53515 [Aspergillus luchuensis CBS 106.47]|uniref:Uncharacterized protein n=1 Tax=Aspergillus luchuensis (strain CBS 106.47) TaxID=1137211 RepID=A0A1M3T0S4_ASPLC|nr:hypothetical protein ASPFODRAFT_53515 [Aspergillus luchuensis CBS 106.47]
MSVLRVTPIAGPKAPRRSCSRPQTGSPGPAVETAPNFAISASLIIERLALAMP